MLPDTWTFDLVANQIAGWLGHDFVANALAIPIVASIAGLIAKKVMGAFIQVDQPSRKGWRVGVKDRDGDERISFSRYLDLD